MYAHRSDRLGMSFFKEPKLLVPFFGQILG